MKNRIEKYGFIENQDFASFDNIIKREKGATVQKEYALSIDCDKLNESYKNGGCTKLCKDIIPTQIQEVNSIEK